MSFQCACVTGCNRIHCSFILRLLLAYDLYCCLYAICYDHHYYAGTLLRPQYHHYYYDLPPPICAPAVVVATALAATCHSGTRRFMSSLISVRGSANMGAFWTGAWSP